MLFFKWVFHCVFIARVTISIYFKCFILSLTPVGKEPVSNLSRSTPVFYHACDKEHLIWSIWFGDLFISIRCVTFNVNVALNTAEKRRPSVLQGYWFWLCPTISLIVIIIWIESNCRFKYWFQSINRFYHKAVGPSVLQYCTPKRTSQCPWV